MTKPALSDAALGGDPATPQRLSTVRWRALGATWKRWRSLIVVFFAGQLSVQLLALVTGLLVLRWMSEDEYAKTGVVLGFQATLAAFVDLGVGGSLVSLIGTRGGQPEIVGAYAAAARWWRRVLIAIVVPIGALAFYFINARQGWALPETTVLFACIAVTLYFSGVAAWASAPLLIHRRMGDLYTISNAGAVARLAGCAALYHSGKLNALTVTLLGALVSAAMAWMYWRASARFVAEPTHSSAAVRREMRQYVAPLVPIAIFFAVQGQLGTFLIAYFGKSQSIAEVTALGRLAQMFAFVSAFYAMLIVPYFAGLRRELLASRYAVAVSATVGFAAVVSVAAFAVPEPLLWLLGHRYAHLVDEVGWLMLGSAIGFAGGAIWSIHSARKWVFWWGTAAYIIAVSAAQLVFLALVDLSTTMQVLHMGVVTSTAALLAQALIAWMGFRLDTPKETLPEPIAVPPPLLDRA